MSGFAYMPARVEPKYKSRVLLLAETKSGILYLLCMRFWIRQLHTPVARNRKCP